MTTDDSPNDGTGVPSKEPPPDDPLSWGREKAIQYLASESRAGKPIVGAYCCYAPLELVYAIGGVPVGLCGLSQLPIRDAEKILPANTCPLVKSSFGFITTGTCPFYEAADAIIAETTCDAKKKMFELIQEFKPFHLLELPQMPDQEAAREHWLSEVHRLKRFLENEFDCTITDSDLEAAIRKANRRRRLKLEIYDYPKDEAPVVTGLEIHKLLDVFAAGEDYDVQLEKVLAELEGRKSAGYRAAPEGTPRVLLTGCPLGGDATKVLEEIEGAGGLIVVNESCSGIKPQIDLVEEDSGDPLRAIAARYLKLPCSVMTPNRRRLDLLDRLIHEYRPDCVVEAVLSACHTYNMESVSVQELVQKRHGLPYLKIETDYSDSDRATIRTRVEALLEMVNEGA